MVEYKDVGKRYSASQLNHLEMFAAQTPLPSAAIALLSL
jgi:hypothetical protein